MKSQDVIREVKSDPSTPSSSLADSAHSDAIRHALADDEKHVQGKDSKRNSLSSVKEEERAALTKEIYALNKELLALELRKSDGNTKGIEGGKKVDTEANESSPHGAGLDSQDSKPVAAASSGLGMSFAGGLSSFFNDAAAGKRKELEILHAIEEEMATCLSDIGGLLGKSPSRSRSRAETAESGVKPGASSSGALLSSSEKVAVPSTGDDRLLPRVFVTLVPPDQEQEPKHKTFCFSAGMGVSRVGTSKASTEVSQVLAKDVLASCLDYWGLDPPASSYYFRDADTSAIVSLETPVRMLLKKAHGHSSCRLFLAGKPKADELMGRIPCASELSAVVDSQVDLSKYPVLGRYQRLMDSSDSTDQDQEKPLDENNWMDRLFANRERFTGLLQELVLRRDPAAASYERRKSEHKGLSIFIATLSLLQFLIFLGTAVVFVLVGYPYSPLPSMSYIRASEGAISDNLPISTLQGRSANIPAFLTSICNTGDIGMPLVSQLVVVNSHYYPFTRACSHTSSLPTGAVCLPSAYAGSPLDTRDTWTEAYNAFSASYPASDASLSPWLPWTYNSTLGGYAFPLPLTNSSDCAARVAAINVANSVWLDPRYTESISIRGTLSPDNIVYHDLSIQMQFVMGSGIYLPVVTAQPFIPATSVAYTTGVAMWTSLASLNVVLSIFVCILGIWSTELAPSPYKSMVIMQVFLDLLTIALSTYILYLVVSRAGWSTTSGVATFGRSGLTVLGISAIRCVMSLSPLTGFVFSTFLNTMLTVAGNILLLTGPFLLCLVVLLMAAFSDTFRWLGSSYGHAIVESINLMSGAGSEVNPSVDASLLSILRVAAFAVAPFLISALFLGSVIDEMGRRKIRFLGLR